MPAKPASEQEAIWAAEHVAQMSKTLITRTEQMQKHLIAAGYDETAERIYHAFDGVRDDLIRLRGEALTAIEVIKA